MSNIRNFLVTSDEEREQKEAYEANERQKAVLFYEKLCKALELKNVKCRKGDTIAKLYNSVWKKDSQWADLSRYYEDKVPSPNRTIIYGRSFQKGVLSDTVEVEDLETPDLPSVDFLTSVLEENGLHLELCPDFDGTFAKISIL